ncbi:MAG: nuclear transport factor 2 family protein [Sphingomicrobium sp.]
MALKVEDYFAIQALLHNYPFLLDRGDFEGLGRMFARAKVFSGGQVMADCNPEQVASAFRDWLYIYEDGTPRTRHCIANVIIEPESDTRAILKSYVMVFQQTPVLPLQPIIGGDYRDTVAKIDGEWCFVARHIGNDLVGNLHAHGRDVAVIRSMRANG